MEKEVTGSLVKTKSFDYKCPIEPQALIYQIRLKIEQEPYLGLVKLPTTRGDVFINPSAIIAIEYETIQKPIPHWNQNLPT